MKKVICILILLLTLSCSIEECYYETTTLEVIYDSQDNVIKIDEGEWMSSLDWETYIDDDNWEAANDFLGIRHYWNDKILKIVSDTYILEGVEINELYESFYVEDNILYVSIPNMQTYMNDTDWFRLKIIIRD